MRFRSLTASCRFQRRSAHRALLAAQPFGLRASHTGASLDGSMAERPVGRSCRCAGSAGRPQMLIALSITGSLLTASSCRRAAVCGACTRSSGPLCCVVHCNYDRSLGRDGAVNTTANGECLHRPTAVQRRQKPSGEASVGRPIMGSHWCARRQRLYLGVFGERRRCLAKPEVVGNDCDMEHRMSDAELRKAIRVLRERADDARHRGREEDANGIERTIRTYQEEMAQRL